MVSLTFEQLPSAVSQLIEEVQSLKRLLQEKHNGNPPAIDVWFDLNELTIYDPEKRSKATFYGYRSSGSIPYHKKGKKLIFLKSEIDAWLKDGRKKTSSEISLDADAYINKKR